MDRSLAVTLDGLYSLLDRLRKDGADIISVDKRGDKYLVVSQGREDARQKELMADYERLRRMERRINTYPDLRKAVRAAMEHEDGLMERSLIRHLESSRERCQRSLPGEEPRRGQP